MKKVICASICIRVVSVTLPVVTFASDGPSANGSFQFALADGNPKFLEFHARVQNSGRTGIPIDSERPDDNGASLSWFATDAERTDDVGIPSNQSRVIGCQSFPLSSYSFVDIANGGGNIQVRP